MAEQTDPLRRVAEIRLPTLPTRIVHVDELDFGEAEDSEMGVGWVNLNCYAPVGYGELLLPVLSTLLHHWQRLVPVSYTHLTLPTKRIV